jgi:hypothetical protein
MTDSEHTFDEEALRKKIREELEREHKLRQENQPESSKSPISKEETKSDVFEHLLREEIEAEVYSKYPEFIRCENHLNEVRWLTPLELDSDYEFYPTSESRFERFRKKIFKSRPSVPDSPEIREMLENYRKDLEEDARERIATYRETMSQKLKSSRQNERSEMEARLFQEEQERFYGSLKGYKKYKNHAGETRWMTKQEFENQDEFIDRVYNSKELMVRRLGWISAGLLLIAAAWLVFTMLPSGDSPGYLIVEMEDADAHLYVDQNPAFGFAPNKAYPIPAGSHEIMVHRSGFVADPASQNIVFTPDDTVRLSVSFTKQKSEAVGVVNIESPVKEAGIFVNGEFKGSLGNNPYLHLPEGEHTIALRMQGYITDPAQQFISLASGDTVSLRFRMISGSRENNGYAATSFGLIEVSSNVKDADIYLNGQYTGHKTDYVLQKVSLGQHIISVKKEGYVVYPEEKTARLTTGEKTAQVNFNLTSTTRQVTIRTVPGKGEIFINGKSAGKGTFTGSLPIGEHRVTFGDIEAYRNPGSRLVDISEDGENDFTFYYITDLQIQFEPGESSGNEYAGSVSTGHILEGISYKASSQVGPEIRKNETVDADIWYLNYAYQYRNPPGSDAVTFRFRLPETLEITKTINLKLWIYRTGDNYPLTLKGRSAYRIIINKGIVVSSSVPENDVRRISEERYEEIPINEFLKSGYNTVTVSTAPDASAAVVLWKVSVE